MKIIHTSDWHLGQRFLDRERTEEHAAFLDHLLAIIETEAVDLLIVAGDIFDTANPPREAERLYFSFLMRLSRLGHCRAVILGGNHDSAPHLDAPAPVLEALLVTVVGAMPEVREDGFFFVPKKGGTGGVWIAAVPYLRDRDVRRAVVGESFEALSARTKAGIRTVYQEMAALARMKSEPVIATGHLTALGSSVGESESERTIHIGNLGSISGADFTDAFSYVALGHIHTPQAVGGNETIRYCGSPIPLSFGERNQEKEIRLIELDEAGALVQKPLPVPVFRRLIRITGMEASVREQLEKLDVTEDALTPWIEVVMEGGFSSTTVSDELKALAAKMGAEVLKVSVAARKSDSGNWEAEERVSEMKPMEVFQKRLEAIEDPEEQTALSECFQYLLEKAEGGAA